VVLGVVEKLTLLVAQVLLGKAMLVVRALVKAIYPEAVAGVLVQKVKEAQLVVLVALVCNG
jgi:hypothetical protein